MTDSQYSTEIPVHYHHSANTPLKIRLRLAYFTLISGATHLTPGFFLENFTHDDMIECRDMIPEPWRRTLLENALSHEVVDYMWVGSGCSDTKHYDVPLITAKHWIQAIDYLMQWNNGECLGMNEYSDLSTLRRILVEICDSEKYDLCRISEGDFRYYEYVCLRKIRLVPHFAWKYWRITA